MSFEDLPADWPRHPLTDPDLVHDVLDLCVSNADRATGGLAVLILRDDLTLAQPVFVTGPLPRLDRREMVRTLLTSCTRDGRDTAFVIGIAHEPGALSDEDRGLHQVLIEVCAEHGLRLVSTHLVTGYGIHALPAVIRAA
ncbi:MAG: hypothetical protein ACR2FV_16285 [Ornithinimicrobium sp.]|uniref:hypothetical protein n=1 Tax=Ornithinimicrobium sp. TaxID=1977084 RepID=UPI00178D72D0|nr:hypothetical protein [Actinomycetota bacterium]